MWTARTCGSRPARRRASGQVASVLALSAMVTRKLNGKLAVRWLWSRQMLASSTCCSLWTGTTISTSGPARARMAAGCCSSGVCMPPMVAPDPWGQLGRAWEVAGSSGGAGGVRGTAGVVPRWVGGQGEDHPEAGAPAGDAVDLDGAAVDGGKGGHDRQAEPGAAAGGGAGRVGPVEALEDPLGLLGGEAGAVVDDLDGGPGAAVEGGGPDPDLDRAAGRGVGEGVVDQVG